MAKNFAYDRLRSSIAAVIFTLLILSVFSQVDIIVAAGIAGSFLLRNTSESKPTQIVIRIHKKQRSAYSFCL
jgi:chromate transporter